MSTILCGKRFDALKVWMVFQTYGLDALTELAEQRVAFTHEIYRKLDDAADFEPSYEPVSPIICFRYLPEAASGWDTPMRDRFHRYIREQLKDRGTVLFNITKLRGEDHFRAILINPLTEMKHVDAMFDAIRQTGREFIAQEAGQEPKQTVAGGHSA
jgi:glutamate/tyrosine decarboxylase-like PLP-dependent enzyme